jgi:hypothetical protein
MHYITVGILIGIGIMLAPYVVDFCVGLIRLVPMLLFGLIVIVAVCAGVYGIAWVFFQNAEDIEFWIVLSLSALALFALLWPRREIDGKSFIRARGLLSGLLVLSVIGLGVLIVSILVATTVMANWRDPSFWVGCAVFLGIATFVIVTARRGRLEREQ